jgi:hypothetical protein
VSFEIRDARARDQVRLHAIHHRATMSSYGRELRWLDAILGDPTTPLEAVAWTIVAAGPEDVLGYAAVTAGHLENLFVELHGHTLRAWLMAKPLGRAPG